MAVMSGPFWNTCTSDLGLVLVLACGSLVMLMLVTFFFVLLTVIQLSLLLTDWSCKDTEIKLLFFIYWLLAYSYEFDPRSRQNLYMPYKCLSWLVYCWAFVLVCYVY